SQDFQHHLPAARGFGAVQDVAALTTLDHADRRFALPALTESTVAATTHSSSPSAGRHAGRRILERPAGPRGNDTADVTTLPLEDVIGFRIVPGIEQS